MSEAVAKQKRGFHLFPHRGNVFQDDPKGQVFFLLLLLIPLAQFAIFYFAVNFNSILLAFKSYDNSTGVIVQNWVGWANFEEIFRLFKTEDTLWICLRNSAIYFALDFVIGAPVTLLFAYYIYKGYPLHEFFKVMLFLPSIICSMVFVIFYKNFIEAFAWTYNVESGTLIGDKNIGMWFIALFYVWLLFSGNILIYLNAMGSVSKSTVEAAQVDGASELQTFFHVMIPGIWPTIVSLVVISFGQIMVNQANLYGLFGNNAPKQFWTLGYYLFRLVAITGADSPTSYPLASAFGLLGTAIIAPLTFLVRYLMQRFGPRED